MRQLFILLLSLTVSINGFAQEEEWKRTWGVEATIGGGSFNENKTLVNEDEYNTYELAVNYYLTPRLTLVGGLYVEQDGVMTSYADGIGMKSFCMAGPEVGAKFYMLPRKWIIQPYIGAMLMTNVLNLGKEKGLIGYEGDGIDCTKAMGSFAVQCPVATFAPKLGLDVRLTENIILTANADFRLGFYGYNRSKIDVLEGYHAGNSYSIDESMVRRGYSVGLKIDLPWKKKDNSKIRQGILNLLYMWICSNAE